MLSLWNRRITLLHGTRCIKLCTVAVSRTVGTSCSRHDFSRETLLQTSTPESQRCLSTVAPVSSMSLTHPLLGPADKAKSSPFIQYNCRWQGQPVQCRLCWVESCLAERSRGNNVWDYLGGWRVLDRNSRGDLPASRLDQGDVRSHTQRWCLL